MLWLRLNSPRQTQHWLPWGSLSQSCCIQLYVEQCTFTIQMQFTLSLICSWTLYSPRAYNISLHEIGHFPPQSSYFARVLAFGNFTSRILVSGQNSHPKLLSRRMSNQPIRCCFQKVVLSKRCCWWLLKPCSRSKYWHSTWMTMSRWWKTSSNKDGIEIFRNE